MTTKTTTLTREAPTPERFPEFPPRDDMQNTNHLHLRSVLTSLSIFFASRPRTLVHSEMPVSPTLGMYVCWDDGMLRFYDPESQTYLSTHQEIVEQAEEARSRASEEAQRAEWEAAARIQAEAEIRRLRQRLEQLGETD